LIMSGSWTSSVNFIASGFGVVEGTAVAIGQKYRAGGNRSA
jgi:hypothetical protein